MSDADDWQCGDCGTLIDGPETRKCPNCGGINFYPLADEIPGANEGDLAVEGDVDRAIDRLSSEDGRAPPGRGTIPPNLLVTGPPRSGKTTVIGRVVDRLEHAGYRVGGLASPERREDGERIGFDIEDVSTGESRVLARVDRNEGPRVGKYRVDVESVDAIAPSALNRAFQDADVIVVDEIAPMEVVSEPFREHVRRALDGEWPVLATVHSRSSSGFIGGVKERADVDLFEVTPETRDGLPDELADHLLAALDSTPRSR